jgi:hypothetical protein
MSIPFHSKKITGGKREGMQRSRNTEGVNDYRLEAPLADTRNLDDIDYEK